MLTVVYAALILCSSGSLSLLIRTSSSLFDDDAYDGGDSELDLRLGMAVEALLQLQLEREQVGAG